MIKVINHLFGNDLVKNNFYLSQFKNIIFETEDEKLAKLQMYTRFMYDYDILNIQFKTEKVKDKLNEDDQFTLFISKYQILWDKLYLENIKY